MAPAITSATSASTPGSGRAPARAKARRPSAIRPRAHDPGAPRFDRACGALGRGGAALEQIQRQAGGRQRSDHVVRHAPGERLQLVGPPFEQRRRAPHQSPGQRPGHQGQQHADGIQHHGVDHRLPSQPADGAPELAPAGGVEVDEAQDGRVEAVGCRLQLLFQHGPHLHAIGVFLDLFEPRDGRRQIRLRLLGRGNQLRLLRKGGQGAVAVPVALERGERGVDPLALEGGAPLQRRVEISVAQQGDPAKVGAQQGQMLDAGRGVAGDLLGGAPDAEVAPLGDRGREHEGGGDHAEGDQQRAAGRVERLSIGLT